MKQRYLKKVGSFLLASAMILTIFSTFNIVVHAKENQLPAKEQFATVEELKSFNTNDTDGAVNPAKVYFGNNNQQWWIAGSQNGNLTLFASSPLVTKQQFEPSWEDKNYQEEWNCDYTSTSAGDPSMVWSNHYGASLLRDTLKDLETSYFTNTEQGLMTNTTIYTNDTKNDSVYSTTEKLYLAYGAIQGDNITVGTNSKDSLNSELKVDLKYWGNSIFWLRAPHIWRTQKSLVLIADPNSHSSVIYDFVNEKYALVPAFGLNLSSVIFASAAPAASSEGNLTVGDTDGDGAFTLRYSASDLGSAIVSYDKSVITLTDVPTNTYLVVQNSNGAYAKQITEQKTVTAQDMGLNSFANCQVWLETTDITNRMTFATLATQAKGYHVHINVGDTMLALQENTEQNNVTGKIEDIIVNAKDGYMFPANYTVTTQNGITVTRNNENQITISGTPTANINMTLPPATKKIYSMDLTGNGTFTAVCKNYQPITAKELTITNNGNVDLENVNVSITGTNADKFDLIENNNTTILPKATIKIKVKPKDNLSVNTYKATLSVSADNANTITTALQFTVNEHDYTSVVTLPTCIEEGYTTYTCKNCTHTYVGNEVNAKGHKLEEWKVIKEATTTETGERERICERCDYKEVEVIPMLSKEKQPTTPTKSDKGNNDKNNTVSKIDKHNTSSVKTGDQTHVLLWSMVTIISLAGVITALLFKRRKSE